uniref:Uncharacterized protein n=1 Tax=Cacopsylla melanoneura TaxID=428564 RepID=A0A8D8X5S7_9HEMI
MLTDELLQFGECFNPSLSPVDVSLVLFFPLLEHSVCVELSGIVHFFHIRCRGRGHSNPAKGRYTLADCTQMIEERRGSVLLSQRLDGRDFVRCWLQEAHLIP